MATCRISPITTIGPECSGHGTCVGGGVCLCDAGWRGFSDFQVTSINDCQTPSVAITVLWAIFLFVFLLFGLLYIPRLRILWSKHKAMVESQRSKGKTYGIYQNKPLWSLLPFFLVGYPAMFVFAVYKLANVDTAYLGQDWVLSVFYMLWRFTFYFAYDMFQANFLHSLLANEKSAQAVVAWNFKVYKLHFVLMQLLSVLIVVALTVPQDVMYPVVGMTTVSLFLLVTSLGMLVMALNARYVHRHVEEILGKSIAMTRDSKTVRLRDRFVKLQKSMFNASMVQVVIYGVYGAFPYLWNKHEFLNPIVWLFVMIAIFQAVNSLIEVEDSSSASVGANASSLGADKKSSLVGQGGV